MKSLKNRKYFGVLCKFTSGLTYPFFFKYENRYLNATNLNNRHPPIFILGAPRSGTTILYQLITNYFDVLFFDNLTQLFYHTPLKGLQLSHKFYGNQPHQSFQSKAGKTYWQGLHAPSEGHLTFNKHFFKELTPKREYKTFKKYLFYTSNTYGKSWVIKNLSFISQLQQIISHIPNAKFIHIQRDPLFTIQSIYLIRQKLEIQEQEWWSIKPSNYNEINKEPLIPKISKQAIFIEKEIQDQLSTILDEQHFTLNYETLCTNTVSKLQQIKKFFGPNFQLRHPIKQVKLQNQNKRKVNSPIFEQIREQVKHLHQKYD